MKKEVLGVKVWLNVSKYALYSWHVITEASLPLSLSFALLAVLCFALPCQLLQMESGKCVLNPPFIMGTGWGYFWPNVGVHIHVGCKRQRTLHHLKDQSHFLEVIQFTRLLLPLVLFFMDTEMVSWNIPASQLATARPLLLLLLFPLPLQALCCLIRRVFFLPSFSLPLALFLWC